MYRFLSISVVLLTFFSFEAISIAQSMPVHARRNVAHRGASAVAPENTLAAYRIAIEVGADGAECDVYRSADGVVFLSHDKTPKRTMGGDSRELVKMNFAEIRALDAGTWKGEVFKGEKVPTLEEYLDVLKGTTCHPVIEIKMDGIESAVLDTVRKKEMLAESTIIAFSQNVVRKVRELEPKISVAYLFSENLKDKGTAEENADRLAELLIKRCKELDTTILDINDRNLSEKLVKTLREAGIHVWCWTVNDSVRMNQLLDWGVESITTDDPERLAEVLKKRSGK